MSARRGTGTRARVPVLSRGAQRWLLLAMLAVNITGVFAMGWRAPGEHVAAVGVTALAILLAMLP